MAVTFFAFWRPAPRFTRVCDAMPRRCRTEAMPRPCRLDVLVRGSESRGTRGPRARPIGHARVCRAIGQVACRLASAETEIFRCGVAHGPAAVPLLQFEERAAVRAGLRRFCERLRFCPYCVQHSLRSCDPRARAVG